LDGAGKLMQNSHIHFDKVYFRYLTVFRDLQQIEGRASAPTEWNGEKDKTKSDVTIYLIPHQILNI
jgi:hypothetical protein